MCHKVRNAMAQRDANYLLAGLVELDDTYFGAKNVSGKRGRGASGKSIVLVAVQLNTKGTVKYASMSVINDLLKETINETVQKMIKKGSTIKTDGYQSYNDIVKVGYKHDKNIVGDPKNASKILPLVHLLIANAKSNIRGIYKGVSSQHLQKYLDEFCYKLNRRFNIDQLFDRLIFSCTQGTPVSIAELRA